MLRTGRRWKIIRNKYNSRQQDAGVKKLKVEGQVEREEVGKGNARKDFWNLTIRKPLLCT